MLAMLEARFRKMLHMQREVYEGTVRLDNVPPPERTHNHEIESGRLSGKESEIIVEVDKAMMLLKEDGTAVALPEAVAADARGHAAGGPSPGPGQGRQRLPRPSRKTSSRPCRKSSTP